MRDERKNIVYKVISERKYIEGSQDYEVSHEYFVNGDVTRYNQAVILEIGEFHKKLFKKLDKEEGDKLETKINWKES